MSLPKELLWCVFGLVVVVMLILDLAAFHRRAHAVHTREALIWSIIWIVVSLLFNARIYVVLGREPALQFLTGYILEKSLSIDNLFVFLVIFTYFGIDAAYQHRVLYWGILGAIVMRGIIIATGTALLQRFHWLMYFFGAFLVFTGIKFALEKETSVHPEQNPFVKVFRRFFPVTAEFEKDKFFVRREGRLLATPMFVVLLVIESSDLVFAIDSIPAVFAVTYDTFIVYTSNIFAILGLRALYFLLAAILGLFRYLRPGLALVLVLIGIKMLISGIYKIPTIFSLAAVCAILGCAILISMWKEKREKSP